MNEMMFQKELTLANQMNQKNSVFIVIIGILKTLVMNMSHMFAMVPMIYQ